MNNVRYLWAKDFYFTLLPSTHRGKSLNTLPVGFLIESISAIDNHGSITLSSAPVKSSVSLRVFSIKATFVELLQLWPSQLNTHCWILTWGLSFPGDLTCNVTFSLYFSCHSCASLVEIGCHLLSNNSSIIGLSGMCFVGTARMSQQSVCPWTETWPQMKLLQPQPLNPRPVRVQVGLAW